MIRRSQPARKSFPRNKKGTRRVPFVFKISGIRSRTYSPRIVGSALNTAKKTKNSAKRCFSGILPNLAREGRAKLLGPIPADYVHTILKEWD